MESLLITKGIYTLLRDIISDVDKIAAYDLERTVEYSKAKYKKDYGKEIPLENLKEGVKQHADEKLLRLRDFIRTKHGKEMANEVHNNLVKELNLFLSSRWDTFK